LTEKKLSGQVTLDHSIINTLLDIRATSFAVVYLLRQLPAMATSK